MINNIRNIEPVMTKTLKETKIMDNSSKRNISEETHRRNDAVNQVGENKISQSSERKLRENIVVTLEDSQLWQAFSKHTNEMIVTRGGRRLFPVYKVKVDGLDHNEIYQIELDFKLLAPYRWKYMGGEWLKSLRSDAVSPGKVYVHPDSPNYGLYWTRSLICFSRMKITNRQPTVPGAIFLHSMYKYCPRLIIKRIDQKTKCDVLAGIYKFKETEFIAVTAYQNDQVTELKVMNNPFAKAFQDPVFVSPEVQNKKPTNSSPIKNLHRRFEYLDRYKTYFNPPIPQNAPYINGKSFQRNYYVGYPFYNMAALPYQTAGGFIGDPKFSYIHPYGIPNTFQFPMQDFYHRNIAPNYIRPVYLNDPVLNPKKETKNPIETQIIEKKDSKESEKQNEEETTPLNMLAMLASQEKIDDYKF